MKKVNKQIEALQKASRAKRDNTRLKVTTVLKVMKEKNIPINFGSVSKLAGISKTWLYDQPELRKEIDSARMKSGKIQRVIDLQPTVKAKDDNVVLLKNKNRKLRDTVKQLRSQLEIVYGELYRLKRVTESGQK